MSKLTQTDLDKHITAVAAARVYWKSCPASAPNLHARLKRLYTARGWAWPAKWTGPGRRSKFYNGKVKIGNPADVYGGSPKPNSKEV